MKKQGIIKSVSTLFPTEFHSNWQWWHLAKNCKPIIIQGECNKKDKSVILFPAWPADWNVKFKLHAPLDTTIEGELKNGMISYPNVFHESRGKDIIFENFKP